MESYKSILVQGLEYVTICAIFYPCATVLYYSENKDFGNYFQLIVEKMHDFLDFVEYVDLQLVEPNI